MEVVEVVKETLWVTWLVRELGVEQSRVHLHYYNYGTIYLTNNQVYHVKIKYVDMRFHKIVELFASRQILLENIHIWDFYDVNVMKKKLYWFDIHQNRMFQVQMYPLTIT